MDRRSLDMTRNSAILAAIARREWLLQMLALGAAGCHRDRAHDRLRSRAATVIVSDRVGAAAFNPAEDTWAKFLVFLPLVSRAENGDLEGRLARRWEHSPDYREWTYHLRPDVRWHDRTPVTAHDVKFSLDLLSHPDARHFPPGYIESVTVVDDSTVTIRSTEHAAGDEHDWTVFYPKHLLEHLDPKELSRWDFWTHPVGNGPYRFVRYLPQTMFELEANADYFAGIPKIERVILKFDSQGSLTELLSGNVDAIGIANPSETPTLRNDPRFPVYHSPNGWVRALYWKNDDPLLRDARVRRALTLAIDRSELQRLLSVPERFPVVDGPLPSGQLLSGRVPAPLPYDPTQARALLQAAGWRDRDDRGVRDRDGTPFQFTLLITGGGGALGVWYRTAVFVQEQLQRIGVRMDIQQMDALALRSRVQGGAFAAALDSGGGVGWFRRTFGDDSHLGYHNAEVTRLLDRLDGTAHPGERERIHQRLIEIFQADVPVTFLGPIVWTTFAHRRLRGLSSPFRTNPLQHMGTLWLDNSSAP